jgi:transposase
MSADRCTDCPLQKRVAELEAELRRLHRQAAPFSRDRKKADPKRPGRRAGQGEFNHRQPPSEDQIDKTEVAPLERCPDCGGPLKDRRRHQTIQTDLPLPKPVHTRFVTESGWCQHCRRRVRSRHPDQASVAAGAAGAVLGPNARSLAAEMHHRLGVPYAKVSDLYGAAFGLSVTPGALVQSDERLAERARPVYDELVEAIRRSCTAHADETGWRIGVLSAWLWTFTNRQLTVYVIDESRGHEVVLNILGRDFKGVLHADCFLAYDHWELSHWIQQKCFAHFLKTLGKLAEEKTRGAVRFPRALAAVLREALALREEKAKLSAPAFRRRLGSIERRLDELIAEGRNFSDPDNRRFAKRLRKQRRHLFTFLQRDGVEATNNRAERSLRPAVVVRKTGGCNKTKAGAQTHSILASVLVTARQRGIDGIAYVAKLLTTPGTPRPLLAVPTNSS